MQPARVLPKPPGDLPELYGVRPAYLPHPQSARRRRPVLHAREDDTCSAAVCVLGESAKINLLGYGSAVGKFVKVERHLAAKWWVFSANRSPPAARTSAPAMQDLNNIVFIPLNTFQYRFWDVSSYMKDELDGVDLRLKEGVDSVQVAKVVAAILNSTHHNVQDFTVTIPAALLAQQKRTQTIFTYVMVAIAAISLLVGGIGIMNIVLSTVLERTREIGIRRAIGARRADIVRQFLIEAVLISGGGGVMGIGFGLFLSWLIARLAEWKTIVTSSSVIIAFGVSVVVGVVFGIYPAMKASRIDPIEALRYE